MIRCSGRNYKKTAYETNFGTAYETYKGAVKINSSVRLQDVKDYLNKLGSIQTHFKYKKYNSFVSPGAKYEFETDIIDVLARDGGGIRYGLCAIDNFSKMVSVIPIENRSPSEIIKGLKLIIEELGKPKQLYSDEESSLRSQGFFRFISKSIKTIQTSTHAHTVERFIKLFENNLYRRLGALGQEKSEWTKHVSGIITKYNNTLHSTIEITPNGAKLSRSHLWVNWHLQNASKNNRPYEEIKKGDMVRIMVKKINPIKPTWRTGQVKNIKSLELMKIMFCCTILHDGKRF